MAEILANGIRQHVQRQGPSEGDPVVFVHGLVMDNLSSWYFTVAPKVAAHAPVLVYDLRGHGKSERPDTGYDLDTLVDDLAALLDAVGAERASLIGNSVGGLIAARFAVRHPDRVRRLALVDALVGAPGWGASMAATLDLRGDDADNMIAREFKSWLGRHSERKRNRLAKAASALVLGTSLTDDMRRSPGVTDEDLAALQCPILGIYGEHSDVLESGQRVARCAPNGALSVYEGCSHSVLWEQMPRVCAELVEFVAPASERIEEPATGAAGGGA